MAKDERIVLPADPAAEDFDVTAEAMERGQRARLSRVTRTKMGLSQPEFAARFHVPEETLREWEESRATAPDFAITYFRVIAAYPDLVTQALANQPSDSAPRAIEPLE
jgi:putative transcriptional regulator